MHPPVWATHRELQAAITCCHGCDLASGKLRCFSGDWIVKIQSLLDGGKLDIDVNVVVNLNGLSKVVVLLRGVQRKSRYLTGGGTEVNLEENPLLKIISAILSSVLDKFNNEFNLFHG